MSRSSPGTLVALVLALTAALAAGHPPARAAAARAHTATSRSDAAALRLERRADALVTAATRALQDARADCRQPPPPAPTFMNAAPSEALRQALLILRRPPIAADSVPPSSFDLGRLALDGVYLDWVRLARAAVGREFHVVAARHENRPAPLSRDCLRDRHERLLGLLDDAAPRLRRAALGREAEINRRDHPARGFPDREVVALLERGADGRLTGGASGSLEHLRTRGVFDSTQRPDYSSDVRGLLPDGIATVELIYAQRVGRGPHRPPEVYPTDVRLILPVQDNVVAYRVARETPDALPTTMVWRSADGSVLRTVRRP